MEKTRNHLAVIQLKLLGYPIKNIRKALPKMTGIEHKDAARFAKVSRECITKYIAGRGNNPEIQAKIAEIYKVPVEELFYGPEKTHAN
jgi:DNA-binding XRE family transcriptional regulator